jgi:hypothetical protein
MTTADDGGATTPAEDLQFEHADFAEAHAPAEATALACGACNGSIAGSYYELHQKVLCDGCRSAILERFTGGSGIVRFLRAVLFGVLAALAGTAVYFLVLATTGYEVGLIAILVGFLVGTAVHKGSRGRGGLAYQALAVFLTYTAIVSSYIPLLIAEIRKNPDAKPDAAAAAPAEPAPVANPAGAEPKSAPEGATAEAIGKPAPAARPARADAEEIGAGRAIGMLAVALAVVMALAFAAPFLAGAQNLIGLFVIFLGLLQAWRLNRKVALPINGPFLVDGTGPPPVGAPAHA